MEVEVCISAASVFVHIQSVDLFLLGYAKSDGLFQDEEQDERQVFQGNLLEPKKGKTVGSAADMTIEYLIDILTYIFV